MLLGIEYKDATHVRFSCQDGNEFVWNSIRSFFPNNSPLSPVSFCVTYNEFVSTWQTVYTYARRNNVDFDIGGKLKKDYGLFRRNQETEREMPPEILKEKLDAAGFKRKLMSFQITNVCRLAKRNQGATFSVPGAGKTTEALAYFFAVADAKDKLLVVAPLNAFGAWDEQLLACTENERLSFVRLTGGAGNIERILAEDHRFMLTNYETYSR